MVGMTPSELDHNLFFFPVNSADGVLYADWTGSSQAFLTMLSDLPGEGANLYENPLLDDSHIGLISPCRNKGTELDAPDHDRDGDERPQEDKFDIGPDELVVDF
jgi:hypothetical protein